MRRKRQVRKVSLKSTGSVVPANVGMMHTCRLPVRLKGASLDFVLNLAGRTMCFALTGKELTETECGAVVSARGSSKTSEGLQSICRFMRTGLHRAFAASARLTFVDEPV